MRLHPLRQGQRPFVGADDHRLDMRARRLGVREAPQGFAHAPHPLGQRGAAVVRALDNAERGADRGGEQGRRRRREDEVSAAIDQELTQHARQTDQRAGKTERLAASVKRDDVVPPLQPMRQPTPARPQHAGRMGLVDQQKRAMTPGDPGQGFERRDVAVHAVEAFDDDPNAARPAGVRGPPPRRRRRRYARRRGLSARERRIPSCALAWISSS